MQAQTHTLRSTAAERSGTAHWRTVLAVFKLRIGVIIALTAMAGIAVQPGVELSAAQVAAIFVAVLLASASAGAFNQFYEVELDRRMRRTRARPFADGRLQPHRGWLLVIAALAAVGVTLAWSATNAAAALFTLLGAFFYAIVYTVWLKRRTWWNIVIGGAAGSFGVLAGAAAVAPELSPQALLLAVILFLWTPPHFWSLAIVCRDDYAANGVPMLPAVKGLAVTARAVFAHVVALVGLSLLLPLWGAGPIYLLCAAGGGAWFVARAWQLLRSPSTGTARLAFRASLVQLSVLLLGAMLDAAIRL
ncbi:MAG: protoheme IX farnesyltransferase [Burkholderiales bacterium]|jgi:protoheme IX farnesyltransferase|nr:protoheme IX farnesyltransferase [Burkholderiales bacterium]